MSNEHKPLSNAAQRALQLERERPLASEATLNRLAHRIEASFGTIPIIPSPEDAEDFTESVSTAKALTLAAKTKVLLVAAGVAAGGLGGAQIQKQFGTPREVVIERVVQSAPAPTLPEKSAVHTQPIQDAPPPAKKRAPQAKRADIDVERLLIEQATSALHRDQAEMALRVCQQHAVQFHSGQLVEERESIAIRALVSLGRIDEARLRVEQFRKRFPESVLLEAVEAAVAH